MGRNKIKIQKIANDRIRQVSYYKRRKGLIKKAMELSLLCDIEVFLTIVDKNNSLSVFSSKLLPSEFIQTYLQLPISPRDSYSLKDYKKLFEEELPHDGEAEGDGDCDVNVDECSKNNKTEEITNKKNNGYCKGNSTAKENEMKNKNNCNVKANNGIIQIVLKDDTLKNKKNNKKSNSKKKRKAEESKSEYEEEEYYQGEVSEEIEMNNKNHHHYNTRQNKYQPQMQIQQQPIESGIINIKLNPPVVLNTEEVKHLKHKNSDKQNHYNNGNGNDTCSELESNMLIINSALSISESDNNNNNENNNVGSKNKSTNNNTNSSNTGLSKLKNKFGLKVNIQAAEELNHKNSKVTSNQSKSAFQSNNQQNDTITINNNSINSHSQINPYFNNTSNSNTNVNVLSQKLSTSNHNMFSFRPEYEYDKQILSASYHNPNYFPILSHNQSHIQSPFVFESPNVLNNNSQMQINQQILSNFNDFIKTMTPPVGKQPEGGYVNMLSNYFQFPYYNDNNANGTNVNDNLNHKRYREDIMNTFTPLSQGRFAFNQNYADNNTYYNRKPMPSLTPTPNSHVGYNFFGDDTNRTIMSTNEILNIQPSKTSTNGILNRNPITEGNNSESIMSPNKDSNCQLGTKLNK